LALSLLVNFLTVILNNRWDVNLDATFRGRLATRTGAYLRHRHATDRHQPRHVSGNDRARSLGGGVRRPHVDWASRPANDSRSNSGTATPASSRFHAAIAFGDYLPDRVVRGIVLARLTNSWRGTPATSPRIARAVASMLDGAPMPPIAASGQGGAGEILALYPLFAQLSTAFELEVKERGSLINGSPCAAALIADSAIAAQRRLRLAFKTFALSIDAFRAPLEHYDAALDSLWGDKDEAAALQALRAYLGLRQHRRPAQLSGAGELSHRPPNLRTPRTAPRPPRPMPHRLTVLHQR